MAPRRRASRRAVLGVAPTEAMLSFLLLTSALPPQAHAWPAPAPAPPTLQTLSVCSTAVPAALKPRDGGACPLPIDDDDDDEDNDWLARGAPWTHRPECERTTDGAAKYCAYTNSRHGARGWSIVTSPQTAADSVGLLDSHVPHVAQQAGANASDAGAPYEVVDVPGKGKGKGLVARRRIRRDEEVLVDYATLLVDVAVARAVPASRGYRLLHAAVDRLADPGSVRGLARSSALARDDVENVLRTNAFRALVGGVPHMALYPAVSVRNYQPT